MRIAFVSAGGHLKGVALSSPGKSRFNDQVRAWALAAGHQVVDVALSPPDGPSFWPSSGPPEGTINEFASIPVGAFDRLSGRA